MKYIACSDCKKFRIVEDEEPVMEEFRAHVKKRKKIHEQAIVIVRDIFDGRMDPDVERELTDLEKVDKIIVKDRNIGHYTIWTFAQPTLDKIHKLGEKYDLAGMTLNKDGKIQPYRQYYFVGDAGFIQKGFALNRDAESWCKEHGI